MLIRIPERKISYKFSESQNIILFFYENYLYKKYQLYSIKNMLHRPLVTRVTKFFAAN